MKPTDRRTAPRTAWLVAAALVLFFPSKPAPAATFRALAMGGQDASAAIPGAALSTFMGAPSLNNNGEAAFFAYLVPPPGSSDVLESLWTSHPSTGLAPVAWQGQAPPGAGPQVVYEQFFPRGNPSFDANRSVIPINDAGDVVFRGQLRNSGTGQYVAEGYWRRTSGSIQTIAVEGDAPAGMTLGDGLALLEAMPLLTDDGRAWLVGRREQIGPVYNPGGIGMWKGHTLPNLQFVAGGDDPAPLPGDPASTYDLFDNLGSQTSDTEQGYSVNDHGVALIQARIYGPNFSGNFGILHHDAAGQTTVLMRPGDAAPGFPAGSVFLSDFGSRINNAGQIAFTAVIPAPSLNQSGLWTGTSTADIRLLARQGDPAPGALGQNFYFFDRGAPVINAQGQIAFRASLTGTSAPGLWRVDELGAVTAVMIPGQLAPGTPLPFTSANAPAINALGQIAFLGSVNDPVNNLGIWATDLTGQLRLVARKGDFIDIDPTDGVDSRRIIDLHFIGDSGNEDGRASGFNDRGQIAFRAWLSDGATTTWAILIANTIPEPASQTLFLLACLAALRRRRAGTALTSA